MVIETKGRIGMGVSLAVAPVPKEVCPGCHVMHRTIELVLRRFHAGSIANSTSENTVLLYSALSLSTPLSANSATGQNSGAFGGELHMAAFTPLMISSLVIRTFSLIKI